MNTRRWFPLILLLWALPLVVKAQFTFSNNADGTLTLVKYSGTNGFAIIPATVNGAAVTAIGPYAFTYPNAPSVWPIATNIEIPATVTTLAPHAFSGMGTYSGLFLMGAYFLGNAPSGTNAFDYFPPNPYSTAETVIYHLAGTTGFDTNLFLGPIQVWYPGQLQISLSPTNAILEGAQWQVDGGPWQTNNAMVANLSPGSHTVSFGPIPGWATPASQMVNVGADFITVLAAPSYNPLPGGSTHTIFQVLHTFASEQFNEGGSAAPLLLVGNTLYGTTMGNIGFAGDTNQAHIFAINVDGTGFTNIYAFTNFDHCYAGLIQSGGVLYGTTSRGVFKLNLDGTGFANLCSGLAGANTGVLLISNTLYGTTSNGGNGGNGGIIFSVNTDGTGFTVLHYFGALPDDCDLPLAGLVAVGNTLYGDAHEGAWEPGGYPFAIQTDGTGYTNFPYHGSYHETMALSGNTLYGNSGGGLFKMNTNGSAPAALTIGGDSEASVIVEGNTLYGTTMYANGAQYPWQPGYFGTIFAVHTDGTGYTNLYTFSGASYVGSPGGPDGANPEASLLLYGTTLYGTATGGGTNNSGTIFMLSFPRPQLGMKVSGSNLIFSWPDGTAGAGYDTFSVQSTTNMGQSAGWTTIPTAPVLVNGLNTVTNPISGTATFYRLSQ